MKYFHERTGAGNGDGETRPSNFSITGSYPISFRTKPLLLQFLPLPAWTYISAPNFRVGLLPR